MGGDDSQKLRPNKPPANNIVNTLTTTPQGMAPRYLTCGVFTTGLISHTAKLRK
jgi:hypothetical protein